VRPRAVLVISPHWETQVATVGTASQLETIHDFGGFDPAVYANQYPAQGYRRRASAAAVHGSRCRRYWSPATCPPPRYQRPLHIDGRICVRADLSSTENMRSTHQRSQPPTALGSRPGPGSCRSGACCAERGGFGVRCQPRAHRPSVHYTTKPGAWAPGICLLSCGFVPGDRAQGDRAQLREVCAS